MKINERFMFTFVLPLVIASLIVAILFGNGVLFNTSFTLIGLFVVYKIVCVKLGNAIMRDAAELLKLAKSVDADNEETKRRFAELENKIETTNTKAIDSIEVINSIIENFRNIGKTLLAIKQQTEANRVTLIRHEKKLRGKTNISLNDR